MATIFSKIIAGEIPSYKVGEDENYYAFLDINPLAKGHTLVVPKKEVDYLFDLDDETLAGMTIFAKKVAHKIRNLNSEKDVDFSAEKLKLTFEEFAKIAETIAGEPEK